MMKGIIIFYKDKLSKYADEKVFSGLSAREISKKWAEKMDLESYELESVSLSNMLTEAKALCDSKKADYVVFAYDDLPFLDYELSKKMISSHIEYKAEYTFADGYPYGFSPEIIDGGSLGILAELAKTSQKELGDKAMARDSIYNLIKTDINSFEVEAELADEDWRLYRFAFHCACKDNFLQTKALYNLISDNGSLSVGEKCQLASKSVDCLKTVPAFYNIQIADFVHSNYIYLPYVKAYEEKNKLSPLKSKNCMSFDDFSLLVDKIADFSEKAVVSISAWGEPFSNPDCLRMIEKVLSYPGLSVFIESDGKLIDEEICQRLKELVDSAQERNNGWQKVMLAVSIDAFTAKTYCKLHEGCSEEDFSKALKAVSLLQEVIPGMVYPQFVRMNENESELEGFFRFWNEKTNPSGGNFIIQKYDNFAGLLPERKPADLSPLERQACWHLRRDLNILSNGDVQICRAYVLSGIIGNVFKDDLEVIWHKTDDLLKNHIEKKYIDKCERCDEAYTYNF
ncbi:MAG: spiro-SPASM protein [Treponema sp.]|nr:spiro-SPASM protein [Treponema sp.]